MTDLLAVTSGVHDDSKDVPLEFDVPLPATNGTSPQLSLTGIAIPQPSFVSTPQPHFHVVVPASAMPSEPTTIPFAASWATGNPPTRAFQVCFQRQQLIAHDDVSSDGEVIDGVDAGGLAGLITGGPGGAVVGAVFGGLTVGAICDKDDHHDEVVMYATVNGTTLRMQDTGQTCLPVVRVRADETLSVGTNGYECDWSCDEHWDDDFIASPNDRIGTVQMAFTSAQNFGAPAALGSTATYTQLSQPDLTTAKSRHFSAGDYRLTVTITEAIGP
jgi:hypothetical protein